MRAFQDAQLARYVAEYLYPFSPYYRGLFDRVGVRPEQVRGIDDLRRLPVTRKSDLLPTDDDPQRFRQFVLQPSKETIRSAWPLGRKLPLLWQSLTKGRPFVEERLRKEFYPCFMTFTTGRSAEPVPFFYSSHDLDRLRVTGKRLIEVLGLDSETRVANVFPYAPHLAFWQVVSAGFEAGMMVLSTGGGKVMGSSGDLRAIGRTRAQALLGVPGYVYHLLRKGVAQGADMSSVRTVVLGAERVPPGMKEKIRALLSQMGARDVKVFGTYGFTEARMAFAECPTPDSGEYSGYHLYPDLALFEVCDPKTGEAMPEGEDGELVFTPLSGRGSTVFRYGTGDLVRGGIQYGACPHCGRTTPRISSNLTRESSLKDLQLLKVKGTLVNLEDCAVILAGMAEIEEWQVELVKKDDDPLEVDEVVIHVALRAGAEEEATATKLRNAFRSSIEISPNRIEFRTLEGMLRKIGMETEIKEKRFLDSRPVR
ncbi:MAG: AMP-binding protein [Planctomycetes bacterium]|nr:AMP-binding protein [Planctomycetota bacterium]MCB9871294.1 AMP-binding protein [Planctomycetota bacterium]